MADAREKPDLSLMKPDGYYEVTAPAPIPLQLGKAR
jgi:hypothetical protein